MNEPTMNDDINRIRELMSEMSEALRSALEDITDLREKVDTLSKTGQTADKIISQLKAVNKDEDDEIQKLRVDNDANDRDIQVLMLLKKENEARVKRLMIENDEKQKQIRKLRADDEYKDGYIERLRGNFPLMRLPLELRRMIYQFALGTEHGSRFDPIELVRGCNPEGGELIEVNAGVNTALLRVSKTVYDEALPELYARRTFSFTSSASLCSTPKSTGWVISSDSVVRVFSAYLNSAKVQNGDGLPNSEDTLVELLVWEAFLAQLAPRNAKLIRHIKIPLPQHLFAATIPWPDYETGDGPNRRGGFGSKRYTSLYRRISEQMPNLWSVGIRPEILRRVPKWMTPRQFARCSKRWGTYIDHVSLPKAYEWYWCSGAWDIAPIMILQKPGRNVYLYDQKMEHNYIPDSEDDPDNQAHLNDDELRKWIQDRRERDEQGPQKCLDRCLELRKVREARRFSEVADLDPWEDMDLSRTFFRLQE